MFIRTSISLTLLLGGSALSSFVDAKEKANADFIAPAMQKIPAGRFFMGSESGGKSAKPMHSVNLPEFYMGKYPVTVAEFRHFIADTQYPMSTRCYDHIDENWMGPAPKDNKASWDNHRYIQNDFQPVTCITLDDANAYIAWLSEKSGITYRLPTEQEWEYATKANTTSRYFWGDDFDMSEACEYGNFADHASEYFASEQYGASYKGFIGHANCNDHEPYISIVGMYRPNPFGLYDLVGNVSQILATCFYEGYEVRTEPEMDLSQCEKIAHRGNTWHFPPVPHSTRNRVDRKPDQPGALMGFRLASDELEITLHATTENFETALSNAQSNRFRTRPEIPNAPQGLRLAKTKGDKLELSWHPIEEPSVVGYDIYRSELPHSHLLGQHYKRYYKLIKQVGRGHSTITLPNSDQNDSFKVVARTDSLTSLASEPVTLATSAVNSLPGKLYTKYAISLKNAHMRYLPANDKRGELFFISSINKQMEQPLVTATFDVNVEQSGWYELNYAGRTRQNGQFFKLWQRNRLLGQVDYSSDIDDKTSGRHKVYLPAGQYPLELSITRNDLDSWYIDWLEFKLINS